MNKILKFLCHECWSSFGICGKTIQTKFESLNLNKSLTNRRSCKVDWKIKFYRAVLIDH